MQRLHARKVSVLNRGGLASAGGCNIADDGVVTTNGKKSAEAIVVSGERHEGPNSQIFPIGGKVTVGDGDRGSGVNQTTGRKGDL